MGSLWCGIDVGDASAHICVIDDNGVVVFGEECPPIGRDVHEALRSSGCARPNVVGIEAGMGTRLTRQLRALGYDVAVFEVRAARRFMEAFHHKSDARDARSIAEIARHGGTVAPRVYIKSPECQLLKSELLLRQRMIQQRNAALGMIRSLLKLHAGRSIVAGRGKTLREAASEALAEIEKGEGIYLGEQILPLVDVYDGIAKYLRASDRKLQSAAKANPICRRLMTIPGVGFLSALSFWSAIEIPDRFRSTASVGAYLGLVPRLHQSGTMHRHLGISKRGDKLTRTLLTLGAKSLLRSGVRDNPIRSWGLRLAERGGSRKAQVAVARKLATVMLAVWKSGQTYDPGHTPARAGHKADGSAR